MSVTVEGQVCRVRALSKRLVFFDLLCSHESVQDAAASGACQGSGDGGGVDAAEAATAAAAALPAAAPAGASPEEQWVEVMAKESEFDGTQDARDTIR